MKKIVAGELPFSSLFFALHTDEVDLNLLANVKSLAKGSEVSLTYTMVDHKVLNMGLNAGESPPPAAARKALIKIWKEFEKQLSIIQEAKRS